MSDGRVVIEVELNTNKARSQYVGFGNEIANDLGKVDQASKKASVSVMSIAKAIGLVKVAGVVFNTLKNSMDAAISRFDTFQRFPKVMDALGFSTEQSDKSIRQLSDGIDGLPTKLDDVVSTTQRMTAMTGNLSKSTQATLALNNAFLASGASASDAQRGTEQYIQQLAKGEVDLQSWRTLQESMSVGLTKTAHAMGFVGEAATTDLYDALKSGKVTLKDFQEQLIKLGTGTGELAKLAKINSEGIGTSFSNLRNTASKGLANVIDALNDLSLAVTKKSIAQNIDNMKVMINKSFDSITNAIRKSEPVVRLFIVSLDGTYRAVRFLSPALIGLATAYAALKVIQTVSAWQSKHTDLLLRAIESGKNLTLVTNAQMTAEVAKIGVQKAGMAATAANNGLIKLSTLLYGVMTGSISLGTGATILMTTATTAFSAALKVAMGPIGWIIGGIGLLTTAGVVLYKWITKETEASKKLNAEQEKLSATTDALTSATDQASESRADNLKYIESNSQAYQDLADKTVDLANKENKSAGDKKLLKDNVEQLNTAFADLNLQYDKETGNLSMTTAQIKERIAAYQDQEAVNETQQQLLDIMTEQNEVGMQLEEVSYKRLEWNEALKNGTVKSKEAKEALADLDEQEQLLKDTNTALGEEYARVSDVQVAAAERVASAIEEGANRQVISYESLSESQQSAVDKMRETFTSLQESATNAFDKISTDSETSLWEMAENMKHNQAVVQQWGENQAALLKWAGENGYQSFMPFIESMGVDQAGVLAEMVKGVDSSNADHAAVLVDLAKTYEEGFGTASESAKNALSTGLEGVPEEVRNMIITPVGGLNEEVKVVFDGLGKSAGEGLTNAMDENKEIMAAKAQEFVDSAKPADGGEALRASFVDVGAAIPDGLEEGIKTNAGSASDAAGKLGIDALKSAKVALDSHSPSRKFVQVGSDVVSGLVLGITQGNGKVKTAANQMVTVLTNAMKTMNNVSTSSMNGYVSSVTSSMSRANGVVQSQTNLMRNTFNNFNRSISTQNTASMASYNNVLNAGMSKSTSTVQRNTNQMRTLFTSMRTMIASQSTAAMNTMVNAFNSGSGRAVSSVNSTRSRMVSSMSGLRGSFYNSGVNASYGLASGINAGSGVAMAAAYNLAARITATLRNAMKIKSPSRVMRDEIGRYIPQGIAVGIDKDAHYVDKSLEDIADSMAKPFNLSNLKKFVPNINGLMSGNLTPELAFGLDKQLVSGKQAISQINNSSEKIVIENQPQVVMHVTWNGKEDIRSSMEKMGYIVNIDERGALGTWHTT